MTRTDLTGKTVVVVGASRGFGRAAAEAFAGTGARVIAVARNGTALDELGAGRPSIVGVTADATDEGSAEKVLSEHDPDVLVLVAGATPPLKPLHELSWEEFSVNWHTDVKLAHAWLGAALRRPLRAGSRVIVMSSGAALAGSPLSGGYAGSKATQRFITGYAQDVARRGGLDLAFSAVLPRITPFTDLGGAAVAAYARLAGLTEADYLAQFGDVLTPQQVGDALVSLASRPASEVKPSYLLTGAGLDPLP